ncbi:hypothetical protein L1F28_09565 [Arthrospira platensis NCB002]|uniref:hypothetical protein n=1 Tax=Limnospira platensis TaxID=118562 RepID=UPI0011D287A9|nr:hypothetical protein [Arthrospira platensis NCB002]BDT10315.1 hypothetical protein N39L_00380 [Arthrospira platensis NIES-39]
MVNYSQSWRSPTLWEVRPIAYLRSAIAQRARRAYRLPSRKCDLSPTLWEVRSRSVPVGRIA